MRQDSNPTKILFIDNDETSFQVRQCIVKALGNLPPVELFHAHDATEALQMMERLNPDVVILTDDEPAEKDLFIDNLTLNHPPIVLQTEDESFFKTKQSLDQDIMYVPRNESLEGIHQTLVLAAAIGEKFTGTKSSKALH